MNNIIPLHAIIDHYEWRMLEMVDEGQFYLAKGENWDDPDHRDFVCGPVDNGHLSDSVSCYAFLLGVFGSMQEEIDVGAAENYHTVGQSDRDPDEVWEEIEHRLHNTLTGYEIIGE